MIILLTPLDLALAAALLLVAAGLTHLLRVGSGRAIVIAATRTVVQLLLVGLVLRAVFAHVSLLWIGALALVMLVVAGYEVTARQDRRLAGWWAYGIGSGSLFVSSFTVTVLALVSVIGSTPWYTPQYAIPLLGMMLGNSMTGVAVGMDRLTQGAWEQRHEIEARLVLGHPGSAAIAGIRRQAIRAGIIPIVNAMAAAGVVSLPGMMTGQILAGVPPVEAVKYQILIMLLISASTIFGTVIAVSWATRRMFDDRERLRLDRLSERRS